LCNTNVTPITPFSGGPIFVGRKSRVKFDNPFDSPGSGNCLMGYGTPELSGASFVLDGMLVAALRGTSTMPVSVRRLLQATFFVIASTALSPAFGDAYFPGPHEWQSVSPAEAGFDPEALESAIAFARSNAQTEPSDLHQILLDTYTTREPDYRVLGPTSPRAGDSGMILSGGRIVAQWGDTDRVDMTFSVVKSYLSTLAALAVNRGQWDGQRLIPDDWFDQLREPTEARPDYGYMWWLNTDRERIPAAPENAYWAAGFGGNYIYVDECNDLVVVLRWIPELAGVLEAKESVTNCAASR